MNLIAKTVFGSHLYGTATPTSDWDVRGIFLPSRRDVLLGRIPRTSKEQGDATDDFELYSLHHFIKLACEGQTLAFDMLWTPEPLVTKGEFGHIWDSLVKHRNRFITTNMSAFVGYSRSQAAKYSLKGARLDKLEKFLFILADKGNNSPLWEVWQELPKDDERINPAGIAELQIAGKWFGATTEIKYVRDSLMKVVSYYGERSQASREGVDWKAMSHALRVSLELHELLLTGNIVFPLGASLQILEVKQGKHNLETVQAMLDLTLGAVDIAVKGNIRQWPNKCDREFWDDWLADKIENYT